MCRPKLQCVSNVCVRIEFKELQTKEKSGTDMLELAVLKIHYEETSSFFPHVKEASRMISLDRKVHVIASWLDFTRWMPCNAVNLQGIATHLVLTSLTYAS
jgi:hypothetical protein